MAKQGGMGDRFLVDEFDVSGDIASLGSIAGPMTAQDVTDITKFANARLGLLHDGTINFTAFWNPSNGVAGDAAHQVLRGRPEADRIETYLRGTTLGNPAASVVTKQINYDGSRNQDGSFTLAVDSQGNGYGLEWGVNLTAGLRQEAVAGNGPSVDLGALPVSYSFGWAAYLHVTAFTGTSVTVKIQDSADNATWADITGASFLAASAKGAQRVAAASATATVRRYVRVVTTGTFTNALYTVNFVRYEAAGHP